MTTTSIEPGTQPVAEGRVGRRDDAIDVARAIAILGMFLIHAVLVLAAAYPRSGPLAFVMWVCDGRAAATFVTLAGVGVARLASKYPAALADVTLRKRALILWIMGVLNLIIWPGDILRVYGVALLLAPMMLRWSARTRVLVSIALMVLFSVGMLLLDWTRHWDLQTLTYIGVWSADGFIRNLFFDGFRPVVPWLAFFLLGTVLAELNLHDVRLQRRLVVFGVLALGVSLGLSIGLDRLLIQFAPQVDALTREGLVGTTSLPPLPLFMLSAFGTTSLLLGAVLLLMPVAPASVVTILAATGRRALTWYILHVVVLVSLYATGAKNSLSTTNALLVGVALFGGAAWWSGQYRTTSGVFEGMMRRLSGGTPGRRVNG
jgi:uncharacterized membrane protein YeiB